MIPLNQQELLNLKTTKTTEQSISLAYYDGTRNPQYLTRRMQDFYNNAPHYKQNWMAAIVNAVFNKLIIEGFQIGETRNDADTGEEVEDPRQTEFNTIWDRNRWNIEADSVHEFCHAVGEGFMVAGENSNGDPVAYAVDPRAVVVYYGGEDPNQITQAIYYWLDGEINKATEWQLQDSGVVRQREYQGQKRQTATTTPASETILTYEPIDEWQDTRYSRIPVFHFRRSSRNIEPEFYQVTDLQDMINKTLVNMGFALEHAANKIRYAITSQDTDPIANAATGDVIALDPAPDGTQPVSVGSFDEADYAKMYTVIDKTIIACSSISNTPRHYFSGEGIGVGISGEALQAMEAPLIAKIQRYIRRYAPVWEDFAVFILELVGFDVELPEVTCNYKDPRTTLTLSEAQARMNNVTAGIPIITQLRNEGWRQNEIDQLLQDKESLQPITMDEAALEQLQERLAETASGMIEPMLEQALTFVADAALAKVVSSGAIETIAAAQNTGATNAT